jgi:hypothetical protein
MEETTKDSGIKPVWEDRAGYMVYLYENAALKHTKEEIVKQCLQDPKGQGREMIKKYPEEFI